MILGFERYGVADFFPLWSVFGIALRLGHRLEPGAHSLRVIGLMTLQKAKCCIGSLIAGYTCHFRVSGRARVPHASGAYVGTHGWHFGLDRL